MIIGVAWEKHHQEELRLLLRASKERNIVILLKPVQEVAVTGIKALRLGRKQLYLVLKLFSLWRVFCRKVFGRRLSITLATPSLEVGIPRRIVDEGLADKLVVFDDGLSTIFEVADAALLGHGISYFSKYEKWMDPDKSFATRDGLDDKILLRANAEKRETYFFGSPVLEFTSISEVWFLNCLHIMMKLNGSDRLIYSPHRREVWFETASLPSWLELGISGSSMVSIRHMQDSAPSKFGTFFSSALVDLLFQTDVAISNVSFISLCNSLADPEREELEINFRNVGRIESFLERIGVEKIVIS